MKRIVLLRHGESIWNREKRLMGWTDIGLTQKGIEDARTAGKLLQHTGFNFTVGYTSLLTRAIRTTELVLAAMQLSIPVHKTQLLNEIHHGALQGLSLPEIEAQYGKEQCSIWLNSYETAAPLLPPNNAPGNNTPLSESLKALSERVLEYYNSCIIPSLHVHDNIIIVSHGKTMSCIIQHLKRLTNEETATLIIPNTVPYVFELDNALNLVSDYIITQ